MTCGVCGNVRAPGAGFPNHVYCKRFLLHMEKREDASRCRDFIPKPQTNADRIRAMTDAELAELLTAYKCVDCILFSHDCKVEETMGSGKTCEELILDWLIEEAKNE